MSVEFDWSKVPLAQTPWRSRVIPDALPILIRWAKEGEPRSYTELAQALHDEFGHEIVHRAQRVGMAPQAYYDQLVRSGAAAAVYGDVRRGKALAMVMERVKITDAAGTVLTLDDLRSSAGDEEDHTGHDHA